MIFKLPKEHNLEIVFPSNKISDTQKLSQKNRPNFIYLFTEVVTSATQDLVTSRKFALRSGVSAL